MPIIEKLNYIENKDTNNKGRKETRCFSGPKGFNLVFYNPSEFRMGAVRWKMKLLFNNENISSEHKTLIDLAEKEPIDCPCVYQPWSSTGEKVFISSIFYDNKNKWSSNKYMYDISSKQLLICKIDGLPVSIQGSRNISRYVAVIDKNTFLLNINGEVLRNLEIKTADFEYPEIRWIDDWKQFFMIGRTSRESKTKLYFFDGESGDFINEILFDPQEILPYEHDKYKEIDRNSFSLVLSKTGRGVGCFLDVWSEVDFDEKTKKLKAKTYRPIDKMYLEGGFFLFKKSGQKLCKVEEKWIEATLKQQ